IVTRDDGHPYVAGDGDGEHEPIVIISVLADQVNATRRAHDYRLARESPAELLNQPRGPLRRVILRGRSLVIGHDSHSGTSWGAASRRAAARSSASVSLMNVPAPDSTLARYFSFSLVRCGG